MPITTNNPVIRKLGAFVGLSEMELACSMACTNVVVPLWPGDFLGLRSVMLHISDHSVEPVTVIEVTEVQVADLLDAFSYTPRLAAAVLWAAFRDEAMVVEHLVDIGRRDAVPSAWRISLWSLVPGFPWSAWVAKRVVRVPWARTFWLMHSG